MGCCHTKIKRTKIFQQRNIYGTKFFLHENLEQSVRDTRGRSLNKELSGRLGVDLRSVFLPQLLCSLLCLLSVRRVSTVLTLFAVNVLRRLLSSKQQSIDPPRCGDPSRTAKPLQDKDSLFLCKYDGHDLFLCKYDGHEYTIPYTALPRVST